MTRVTLSLSAGLAGQLARAGVAGAITRGLQAAFGRSERRFQAAKLGLQVVNQAATEQTRRLEIVGLARRLAMLFNPDQPRDERGRFTKDGDYRVHPETRKVVHKDEVEKWKKEQGKEKPKPKPKEKGKGKAKPKEKPERKPRAPAGSRVKPVQVPGVTFSAKTIDLNNPVDKLGQDVRKEIGAGIRDEKHAMKVGGMLADHIEKEVAAKHPAYGKAKQELDDLNKAYEAAQAKPASKRTAADKAVLANYRSERNTKEFQFGLAANKDVMATRTAATHAALARVRDMGGAPPHRFSKDSVQAVQPVVEQAAARLPRDWMERSHKQGTLRVMWADDPRARHAKDDRGYQLDLPGGGAEITTSKTQSTERTMTHEMIHRCEQTTPRIMELEKEHHARRTKGESRTLIGGTTNEYAHRDQFFTHYTGKTYAGTSYHEIMTTGADSLLSGDWGHSGAREGYRSPGLVGDPETYKFVLGVLAGV